MTDRSEKFPTNAPVGAADTEGGAASLAATAQFASVEAAHVPGYRNYRLYADESGFHNAPYYGFGALVIPHERRGDLPARISELAQEHRCSHELKWSRVNARTLSFALAVVHEFFARPWMAFHCIVVERSHVDMSAHDDWEQALRKHWAMFLGKKVQFFNQGAKDKAYHVIVDKPPYSYAKADEAAHKIMNHTLKRDVGSPLVRTLTSCDSKKMLGIQAADLLLGAVLAARQGEVTAEPKRRVMAAVADHIGWSDLNADTRPEVLKFNIWNFQDPRLPRREKTRPVYLKIPYKTKTQ